MHASPLHPSSQANDPVPLTHVLPDGQVLLLLYIQHNLQPIASTTFWGGEQLCPLGTGVEGVALPHASEDLGQKGIAPLLSKPLGMGALPSLTPSLCFYYLGLFSFGGGWGMQPGLVWCLLYSRDALQFLVLLPPNTKCWDYRYELLYKSLDLTPSIAVLLKYLVVVGGGDDWT